MDDRIIYEDNHLLVINKKGGELSQGDQTGDQTVLDEFKEYIKEKYNKPGNVFLAPAHRLDRPVSGCLILGRTSKGLSRITQEFKKGSVKKEYLAVVDRKPPSEKGVLADHIVKDERLNKSRVVSTIHNKAKSAILEYELLGKSGKYLLLLVKPQTGRSHQIRVQLSHMGCPIVGDTKYGSSITGLGGNIALHCYRMTFLHPTIKEMITVFCYPPADDPWLHFNSLISTI